MYLQPVKGHSSPPPQVGELFEGLTEERDSLEMFHGHLEDKATPRGDDHGHEDGRPADLETRRGNVTERGGSGGTHSQDLADVLVVVGQRQEDRQHEEVAADDDVGDVALWRETVQNIILKNGI